jgi:hypothetical protein
MTSGGFLGVSRFPGQAPTLLDRRSVEPSFWMMGYSNTPIPEVNMLTMNIFEQIEAGPDPHPREDRAERREGN